MSPKFCFVYDIVHRDEDLSGAEDDGNRTIGDIDIPEDATPDDVTDILTEAGSPSLGNTQDDEENRTSESGTVHEVDVNGEKTKVRVMDGKGNNGPRVSVNSDPAQY